jgi:hypothetical protein
LICQNETSQNSIVAAQSGIVTSGQQSWVQTVVDLAGPSQFSFWWNVSSQSPDGVGFSIDGSSYASISGTGAGWQFIQDTNLSAGSHTLQWTYTKYSDDNPTGIPFSDSAWVGGFNIAAIGAEPFLNIQRSGANSHLLFWNAPATGFVLQETTNLTSSTWVNVTNPVILIGATNEVIISATNGTVFFRLLYP